MNVQMILEAVSIVGLCFTLFQLGRAYEICQEIRKNHLGDQK